MEEAEKERLYLTELEQLQSLGDQIEVLKHVDSNNEYQTLDKEPVDDLANHDIQNVELSKENELRQSQLIPENTKFIKSTERKPFSELNQKKKDTIINMYNDVSSMPPCSERNIIRLIYYILLKLADESILSDKTIQVPDQIEEKIQEEFKNLKEQLKIEEQESEKIKSIVEQTIANAKIPNWDKVKSN
ncbi:unnamed protein product, partial [Didymodactylos carnosus]